MTEQEFRQELDKVVTAGLNSAGVSAVYAQLSAVKQFVEVVYDTSVVESINRQRAVAMAQQIQEKGETQ